MDVFGQKPPFGGLGLSSLRDLADRPAADNGVALANALRRISGLVILGRPRDQVPNAFAKALMKPAAQSATSMLLADIAAQLYSPQPGSDEFIKAAWQKARCVEGYDALYIRIDRFGTFIARSEYGTCSQCGWQLDHIRPKSHGGSDDLYNREPLHWRNNLAKSDAFV